jgi:predicted acyl esterase
MLKIRCFPFAILIAFALTIPTIHAQQTASDSKEDYVRAHYAKYEYRIPMRDGKRLFTAVYVPKDAAQGPYPFLINRTP